MIEFSNKRTLPEQHRYTPRSAVSAFYQAVPLTGSAKDNHAIGLNTIFTERD